VFFSYCGEKIAEHTGVAVHLVRPERAGPPAGGGCPAHPPRGLPEVISRPDWFLPPARKLNRKSTIIRNPGMVPVKAATQAGRLTIPYTSLHKRTGADSMDTGERHTGRVAVAGWPSAF
jgi:hypothetical protein